MLMGVLVRIGRRGHRHTHGGPDLGGSVAEGRERHVALREPFLDGAREGRLRR
jgi:hypothetical protein